MERTRERLWIRAATLDELLSDAFDLLPGRKADTDRAALRLAAWCRAAAGGDWARFEQRLHRDGWSLGSVLPRLATVRPVADAAPRWLDDALWVRSALRSGSGSPAWVAVSEQPFGQLVAPLVREADHRLGQAVGQAPVLAADARQCLRTALLDAAATLLAPALYERFAAARTEPSPYRRFVTDMAAGGLDTLFDDLPVLLRLLATVTRGWIDACTDLATRLHTDLPAIRAVLLAGRDPGPVVGVTGGLSDPHDGGRTVQILTFADGTRVVYKPKDLRFDAAWCALVDRLNRTGAPVTLTPVRTLACDGYGWTEYVEHTGCHDHAAAGRFFRRAGAWLALFHCFGSTDMHHENILAAGEHPVPIDLEMALQAPTEDRRAPSDAEAAHRRAADRVAESVAAVGLLPSYGKESDNTVFAVGGVTAERVARVRLGWLDVNTDRMRPHRVSETDRYVPNLPHVAGRRVPLEDHLDEFIAGFDEYARFLAGADEHSGLFGGFGDTSVRAVLRPTRFYGMLLARLRDHRQMTDGALWSAQADFLARLSDWSDDGDPLWAAQRAERAALLALDVPRFVAPSDGTTLHDATGPVLQTDAVPGLTRARARLATLDDADVAWQVEVIRQSTILAGHGPARALPDPPLAAPTGTALLAHADAIADELIGRAIRAGSSAAWIGLDWLGDSEVSQLAALGRDLYGGAAGIAVFLATHAARRGADASAEVARAALAGLRAELHGRNAARLARSIGIGAGTGLGSVLYALAVVADSLDDGEILADAHTAVEQFTDDLIGADVALDAMGGAAGAILALLRLHRQTSSPQALDRAIACGSHLLAQPRRCVDGVRSWKGLGPGSHPLNGISHGAAGFALALAALGSASGDREFTAAAAECVAFENATYDAEQHNWPDLRFVPAPHWPVQWCHGAPGIGLARVAILDTGGPGLDGDGLRADVRNAVVATENAWPARTDILCCGTLGGVELLRTAARILGDEAPARLASRRLAAVLDGAAATGDFRWTGGDRRFNLGLFRGLAGVGYTVLRQVDATLPNVLVWG
ncbi:type 2 lanthipeptide synthetase LanM family protein [Mycolicibacterium sp.]|uniref:type 2 lanthipeptide synthetase LanM family protein n=1 Tax=Mycolicibacterium sp. TaxID=2320850 RepID=UPI003D0B4B49